MIKLKCPECKKDISDDIKHGQTGYAEYEGKLNADGHIDWELNEFEADGEENNFFCGWCCADIHAYLQKKGVL